MRIGLLRKRDNGSQIRRRKEGEGGKTVTNKEGSQGREKRDRESIPNHRNDFIYPVAFDLVSLRRFDTLHV